MLQSGPYTKKPERFLLLYVILYLSTSLHLFLLVSLCFRHTHTLSLYLYLLSLPFLLSLHFPSLWADWVSAQHTEQQLALVKLTGGGAAKTLKFFNNQQGDDCE